MEVPEILQELKKQEEVILELQKVKQQLEDVEKQLELLKNYRMGLMIAAREQTKLTFDDLAVLTGISAGTVCRWVKDAERSAKLLSRSSNESPTKLE